MRELEVIEPGGILSGRHRIPAGATLLVDPSRTEVEAEPDGDKFRISEHTGKRWMKVGFVRDPITGEQGVRSLAPVKLDVHSIG